MPRVLVWLNLSLMDNPLADGCHIFAKNLMKQTLAKNSDYHFYYCADERCAIDFEDCGGHVTVIPVDYPGWARFQRFHFNIAEMWKKLVKDPSEGGWDFDVVFNQQPEISPNLSTMLNSYKGGYYQAALAGQGLKRTVKYKGEAFFIGKPKKMTEYKLVPFVNYFQVLAVQGDPRFDPVEFFKELEGVLASDISLMPSNWILEETLAMCRSVFKDSYVDLIRKKCKVLYFGIPFNEFEEKRVKHGEKYSKFTIGWNSRILSYTGFDIFVKYMKELWHIRKDFQIMFFDPMGRTQFIKDQNPELPILIRRLPREKYIEEMSKCDVIAGTFRFQQFPQALTDAMICEIPVIAIDKFALPEIMGPKYPWLYKGDKDFIVKIQQIMDSQNERKKWGAYLRQRAKELFDWNTVISQYMKIIEDYAAIKMPPAGKETELMGQLLKWIMDRGGATKKDVYTHQGWGMTFSQIPWYRYRKFLLATGALTEDYSSPIVHFLPRTHGQTTLTKLNKEVDFVDFGKQPNELEIQFPEDELKIEFT